MTKEYKILKSDWNWIDAFQMEKRRILMILGSHAVAIGYAGGKRSVRQETRAILDMFIGVEPFRGISFYQSMFGLKDYRYVPTDLTEQHVFRKYENGFCRYNLHILPYHEEFYKQDEFLLRDYLRENPEMIFEYGDAGNFRGNLEGILTSFWNRDKMRLINELNLS